MNPTPNGMTRPRNPYELIGLIKTLGSPKHKGKSLLHRQEACINMLLAYINNPQITGEVFAAGLMYLSDDLLRSINK